MIEVTELRNGENCCVTAAATLSHGASITGHGGTKREALINLRHEILEMEALLTNADVEISNILDNL